MTLILTLANDDQAILVADRKLTAPGTGGAPSTPLERTKATICLFADARLAAGYTGIAEYDGFETPSWLLETLTQECGPEFRMEPTLRRVCEKLSERVDELPVDLAQKGLSIVFVGWGLDTVPPRSYVWLISNQEDFENPFAGGVAREFRLSGERDSRRSPEPYAFGYSFGKATKLVERRHGAAFGELVKARRPPKALVGKAVDVIRDIAQSKEAGGAIGKDCISVVVPRELSEPAVSEFHPVSATSHVFFADEARCTPPFPHARIATELWDPSGKYQVFPTAGRNDPCPCGSGKKFKRCHGTGESLTMEVSSG